MTVWCHLPTILKRRHALLTAGLITLCVAFITTLLFAHSSYAASGVNQTISFQGRLTQPTGGIVADGYYNIQFKIYQDGDGVAVGTTGSPAGTPEWVESYVNNNNNEGVYVKNGYFSVTLGSKTAFGSSVDWNQDTLYLSMNVAGTAANCTNFALCNPDGEMTPMKRITSVPYALQAQNANTLENKTANNFIQLAQGVQTDTSTNTPSIFINKTGSGNLLQLQNASVDIFSVGDTGDLTFGSNADHLIAVSTAPPETAGKRLAILAGAGGSGSGANGGNLILQGGDAGGTNGNGGNTYIDAGNKSGAGTTGVITIGATNASGVTIGSDYLALSQNIYVGGNNTAGNNTNVTIGNGGASASGSTTVQAKDGVTIKTNGATRATFDASNTLYLGNGVSSVSPTSFTLQATNSAATAVAGGALTLQGGNATTGNANGGDLLLDGGAKSGSGAGGAMVLGATNASSITLGNTNANIVTTLLGTTVFKPTTGNDSTSAFQIQRANGTAMFTADSVNQTITFGNSASGNYTVISTATGQITKYGTARNAKKITLAAEYTNSVLDAGSGSNNSGTMTSSVDLTNRMNYYKWTTSQGSNQSYDVVVQVPLPSDFDGWGANPLAITARTSDTTDGTITLEARDSTGTERCDFVNVTPGSTDTWATNNSACTLSSGTYTAGDYITLRIRLQSPNGGDVRIGNINLNYLSKY